MTLGCNDGLEAAHAVGALIRDDELVCWDSVPMRWVMTLMRDEGPLAVEHHPTPAVFPLSWKVTHEFFRGSLRILWGTLGKTCTSELWYLPQFTRVEAAEDGACLWVLEEVPN